MEMSKKAVAYIWSMVSHLRFQYNATFPIFLFLVCVEKNALGIINLLSSLGRMWVSFHYRLLFGGMAHASAAWFCFQASLLSWVVINLEGFPILFSTYSPLLGLILWSLNLSLYFVPIRFIVSYCLWIIDFPFKAIASHILFWLHPGLPWSACP